MNVNPIIELQTTSGAKAKQDILQKYASNEWFKKFLYYALNPLLTYNISEKTLRDFDGADKGIQLQFFNNIFECCEYLSRLRGLDDATIRQVKILLYNHYGDEERELYIKLLAKTLRLGVTAKTVNKVIPDLIPEWEVQQAYPIDKYPIEDGTLFWLTQKLNGVRATFYNGQLIARSGVPYKGLEHIIREISWIQNAGFVLDGELTLMNTDGISDNEAFRIATGILNSDDVNKTTICYTVFDAISVRDFERADPIVTYANRRIVLDEIDSSLSDATYSKVLPVLYCGRDISKIDEYLDQMVREDKEGLMVNLDVPYRRTRHKGILKVKRFYTMDLPIVRYEEGSGRLAGTLGAFVLKYNENEVKVGSGFTDEQRQEYWLHRDDLIGTLCEVKYKEISKDKNTELESLQFPVFVRLREDKSEVSFG